MIFTINTPLRFHIFGISHFVGLAVGCLAVIGLLIAGKFVPPKVRRGTEISLALLSFAIPIVYIYWLYEVDLFNVKSGLPLQICSVSLILCGLALLTDYQIFISLVVFLGLPSAVGALIFPDFTFDCPHFRYYEFFVSHFLIVFVSLYLIMVKKVQIRYKDMVVSLGILVLYVIFIIILNNCLHADYLYIARNSYRRRIKNDFAYYSLLLLFGIAVSHIMYGLLYIYQKVFNKSQNKKNI